MNHIAKRICLLLCLSAVYTNVSAQDKVPIKFGKVTEADFNVQSPLIDSSTNAVVVADVGSTDFMANTSDLTFSLVFKHKKRIKLINKNGFDAATIIIPVYVSSTGKEERLEGLSAYTYNLENGKVAETKVDKDNIFSEKNSKNWVYKKFTFPAIKEGSILEYSYQIKSDFLFEFREWEFQGEYPVLWSQYDAGIPEFFKYVILSQGYQSFFINKNEESRVSFSFVEHVEREGGFTAPPSSGLNTFTVDGRVDYHTWVMKDVPGLKEEPYTTTLRNAIAKIEFQLNQIAYPHSFPHNYMDNWEKISSDMMNDEDFGALITRPNNWLDDDLAVIIKGASSQKEKIKKIYEYVRDNFTCNGDERVYVTKGLKDVFKNRGGTVADINMLLIAMLRNRDIAATPVILSTRHHGFTHEVYPLLDRFNYVIAKVNAGNETIYLDATEAKLPFGKLPPHVYNGHAREITKTTALPVYFMADSLRESDIVSVFISNMDKGTVEGTYTYNPGLYHTLSIRNKMVKTQPAEYAKSLQAEWPDDVLIENVTVDSLKKLDEPVTLKFDMRLKAFENGDDLVYLNPMLGEVMAKNPFAAAQRFYPVEMPYTFDDMYTLYMEVPKGYVVDEVPKSVRLNFNEDEGMFEYLVSANENEIQMRCRLLMKRANFTNEEYQPLRDFYSFVIKKEAEQIVFKKKK
jgi:Transglutaminase-like superfamily/Domain of Unknown Function with PDB structure (DUF3857)